MLAAASVQASDNHVLLLHASVKFTSSSLSAKAVTKLLKGIATAELVESRNCIASVLANAVTSTVKGSTEIRAEPPELTVSYPAYKQTMPRFVSLAVTVV